MSDLDALRKMLDEAGLPHDGDWVESQGSDGTTPDLLKRQAAQLSKLKEALEVQLGVDKDTLARALEAENKIKNGGGQ